MNPVILSDNRFLDGPPVATDTASGYDVLNIKDLRTYTLWKAASFGTKYLSVDCGSAKSADGLGMISHNLYTANATISVESSATGAWAGEQTVRLAGFVPSSDKAFFKPFTTASARYWRIKIVTASVAAMVGVVILGVRLTFPYPPETPHTPYEASTEAETNRSKSGHILGSVIRYRPIRVNARFSTVLLSWIDSYYKPFWEAYGSALKPFFWVWDYDAYPATVLFVSLSEKTVYGTPLSIATYADSIDLDMEGVLEV